MNISRVLTTSTLAAALAFSLTACGDDDDRSDASEASTRACRTYELQGGAGATAVTDELTAILQDGSYEPEPLLASLARVRDAAALAGKVEDLPEKDFVRYRNVVTATEVLSTATTSSNGGFDSASVRALSAADDAVRKACD